MFRQNEIIILLGAGASVEAEIPASAQMIGRVEKLLASNPKWTEHKDLYNCIKSAILYSRNIKGIYDVAHYNIESLVHTLDELVRGDEHALYPFIGSWTPKLQEVTKGDMGKVRNFRNKIVTELRDVWVQMRDEGKAQYYEGLYRFQRQYQFPLRVFTLNYDLCVEKACKGARIQRGFDLEKRSWEWRLFDEASKTDSDIYLYKLHGSIDWTYEAGERLTYSDSPTHIPPEELAIIFGVTYKLQYLDPFLFFAYEFRRWTLDSNRLIVSIGYGFNDDHINGIIRQSINTDPSRRLLTVSPASGNQVTAEEEKQYIASICTRVGIRSPGQVAWSPCGAKSFFTNELRIEKLAAVMPLLEEPFPEIVPVRPSSPPPKPRRNAKRKAKAQDARE